MEVSGVRVRKDLHTGLSVCRIGWSRKDRVPPCPAVSTFQRGGLLVGEGTRKQPRLHRGTSTDVMFSVPRSWRRCVSHNYLRKDPTQA